MKDKVLASAQLRVVYSRNVPSHESEQQKSIREMSNTGFGLDFSVTPSIGVRLDARYIILFAETEKIKSLNTTVGFFFSF
jgi:hypothetical protein